MSIVISDPALQSKLCDVAEVKLCDSAGKPLGHFVSPELFRALLGKYAGEQVSLDELNRRFNEPGGSTLQQIWSRIESQ